MKVLFRAKLNIEQLARGNDLEAYLHKVIRHYVNRGTIIKDGDDYYGIGLINSYEEIEVYDKEDKQVLKFPYYEDTRSIHFEDMLDSKNNPIFASLSESGKGGDRLYGDAFKVPHCVVIDKFKPIINNYDLFDLLKVADLVVIGIQK